MLGVVKEWKRGRGLLIFLYSNLNGAKKSKKNWNGFYTTCFGFFSPQKQCFGQIIKMILPFDCTGVVGHSNSLCSRSPLHTLLWNHLNIYTYFCKPLHREDLGSEIKDKKNPPVHTLYLSFSFFFCGKAPLHPCWGLIKNSRGLCWGKRICLSTTLLRHIQCSACGLDWTQ